MKITSETAASLGNKLGELDLTEEEAVLLHTLIGEDSDAEVSGFGKGGNSDNGYTEVEWTFKPLIRGPLDKKWDFGDSNPSWIKIEMT